MGKERLDALKVPEIVGKVHTLNSSGDVLLISGDKGFAIFDEDFNCIYETALNVEKIGEVIFADRHKDQLTFVFGHKNSKKIFSITHTVPRKYQIQDIFRPENKRDDNLKL